MNTIDYQQECGLTRYPFRDNATLVWSSGSAHGILPNSIFRDAKLTVFSGSISAPRLNSIVFDGTGSVINMGAYAIAVPAATGVNTYTSKNSTALICIDIDNDALTAYFSGLGAGTYSFDSTCTLCLSCIKVLPPKVTRLSMTNTLHVGSETVYDNNVAGTGVGLVEGTNVGFTVLGDLCNVDVNRGLGAGQYDGCINTSTHLYTVNKLTPDAKGNYLIGNDFCYSTYRTSGGLHLKNTCKPRCTSDDLINTAGYYNRVGDLSNQLANYVGSTNDNYNSWLGTIETLEANKGAHKLGYVLATSTSSANRASQYHNIGVGIYYPHFKSTATTLKAFYNTSEFQLVPGSYYTNEENTKRVLPDFTPNTVIASHVPVCQSTKYYGFVLNQAVPHLTAHSNLGSNRYDLHLNMTTAVLGNSGFILPVHARSFNFTIKYSMQNVLADPADVSSTVLSKVLKFDLTFIDPTGSAGATTLNTNAGSLGQLLTSQTKFNNVLTNYISAGFANTSMTGSKDNHYYLTVNCPVTVTGNHTITFSATGHSGTANKSVTINFS